MSARGAATAVAAIVDLLVVAAAYLLATGVRLGGRIDTPEHTGAAAVALLAGAVQVAANLGFRVYRRDWSVAALEDVSALAASSAIVAAGLVGLNLVSPDHFIPNGAVLPGLGLAIVAQAAIKLRPRWPEIARAAFGRRRREDPAILVGAGRTGQLLARDLADGHHGIRVACFVDEDPRRGGTYVRGAPVAGGIDDLPGLIARHRPSVVVISADEVRPALTRRVLDVCRGTGVRVQAVSGFSLDRGDRSPLRPIAVEELLEREPVTLDDPTALAYIRGKDVLITGGAGSVGRELARRVLELGPRRLVLTDISETGLHDALLALTDRSTVEIELGDVRDLRSLERQLERRRPDVVFHAAAYKHVPLVERQPEAGIATNVLGTANLLDAAARAGTGSVVFISSDKAVSPVNVLGLTKRCGELLTLAHAAAHARPYAVVRFGNVLGSSGSVVPIFAGQIDRGGPLTVTDPEATRYFMTPAEAAGLVIHAAALAGAGGDLLVLDMGAPVRILDLARTMIWLRGLRTPDDISIEITGLRPGERLEEQLFFEHEVRVPTARERVLRVANTSTSTPPLSVLVAAVGEIARCHAAGDVAGSLDVLRRVSSVGLAEAVPS